MTIIRPATFLLASLLLAGCQTSAIDSSSLVFDTPGPVGIDVESFAGDVMVNVDPAFEHITLRFTGEADFGAGRTAEGTSSLGDISVGADLVTGELGPVLQVRTSSINPEPHYQRVDIEIDIPDLDGVRIETRRGRVWVSGANGEVAITTTDGDVRFITSLPMTRPVSIICDGGDIDFRVRGNSRGALTCEAIDGRVLHRARVGRLLIRSGTDHNSLNAILNDGDNPVDLRAVEGDVRVAVVEHPEQVGLKIVEP